MEKNYLLERQNKQVPVNYLNTSQDSQMTSQKASSGQDQTTMQEPVFNEHYSFQSKYVNVTKSGCASSTCGFEILLSSPLDRMKYEHKGKGKL